MEHLFSGNALSAVDAEGRTALPAFVRTVVERHSDARALLFGTHESDPCLTAYDPSYAPVIHAEVERRRLRDEALGGTAADHHARARRVFGVVEDSRYDVEGRLLLPPMMRHRGRIDDLALFVGTGGSFEIWNPHVAREVGDPALRDLAEYRLLERSRDHDTVQERES